MKHLHILGKIVLSLILFFPIPGVFGLFPAPTADLYNTPEAFAFIEVFMASYIPALNALIFTIALVLMWTKRMALAMLLILPITVNVIGFHLFLDGGLFTPGAVLGNIMLVLNLYFMWHHHAQYRGFLIKST